MRLKYGAIFIGLMAIIGFLAGCSATEDDGDLDPITDAIVADHKSIDLSAIPDSWIEEAKQKLHIAYGTASHGSQLYFGAAKLATWQYGGAKYAFNNGGSGGGLDWRVWIGNFGNLNIATSLDLDSNESYNRTAWEEATRVYLNSNPGVNVIMWAWCYGADTTEDNIELYLSMMTNLEQDYPNVRFVYMTGHANGTGETGDLHLRNRQIRDYCLENDKILYDFYDIECWDPDGHYYGDKDCDADCSYDSNGDGTNDANWAVNWQSAHPQPSSSWFPCDDCFSAHSQPLNCNLKASAVWWLWARLAGWDGN